MKQMHLQELMDLIVVIKPITALLKMLHPVETGILNFRRKAFLYSNVFNISDEHIGAALIADILLKNCGHQTYILIDYCPMRLLRIHLEI
jgi:hypothetical protein